MINKKYIYRYLQHTFKDLKYINNKLITALNNNNYLEMNDIQSSFLNSYSNYDYNMILSETGSGKTLSYLIPILNDLINTNFNKNIEPHGAIIFTANTYLAIQIYVEIRRIMSNFQNDLKISRLGPMLNLIPIIKHKNDKKFFENNHLQDIIYDNYVKINNWRLIDILITSPILLNNLTNFANNNNDPLKLNPKIIIFDEADHLFLNNNNFKYVKNILNYFFGSNSPLSKYNSIRKVIISSATIDENKSKLNFIDLIKHYFPNINIITSDNFKKIPNNIKLEIINTKDNNEFEHKINVLLEYLSSIKNQKVIIFSECNNTNILINDYLLKNNYNPKIIYSKDSNDDIIKQIFNYEYIDNTNNNILITTDICSRGIDFKNVDIIIQFEFPKSNNIMLHRCGRTGRFGKKGKILTLLSNKEIDSYNIFLNNYT